MRIIRFIFITFIISFICKLIPLEKFFNRRNLCCKKKPKNEDFSSLLNSEEESDDIENTMKHIELGQYGSSSSAGMMEIYSDGELITWSEYSTYMCSYHSNTDEWSTELAVYTHDPYKICAAGTYDIVLN